MKRYVTLAVMVSALFSGGVFTYYQTNYTIEESMPLVESAITEYIHIKENKLNMIELKPIDNTDTYIALFHYKDQVGYAQLDKGLNGKFKVLHAGLSSNIFSFEEINTNKGTYGLVIGENTESADIINVKLVHGDYKYQVDTVGKDYVIDFHKMPKRLKQVFPADVTYQ